MKVINLGFAKIPLEGLWPIHVFGIAIVWGWLSVYLFLSAFAGTFSGPALQDKSTDLSTICAPIAVITVLWNILYRNILSVQSNTNAMLVFQVFPPTNLSEQYHHVTERMGGNTLEQAPTFLTCLWLYTLLVDSGTAVPLGYLYLVSRSAYPIMYAIPGEFAVHVEFATTPGYAVIGLYMLGIWTKAMGGDWRVAFHENLLGTTLKAYAIGFLSLFPGLPFGPLYFAVHYLSHQRWRIPQKGRKGEKCKT